MKRISYSFNKDDIPACLFALTQLDLLHDDEISDIQVTINEQCAVSASNKLASSQQLTPNEIRVLCCCISLCNAICQGDFQADEDTRKECMRYMFSLNKLDKELCSQIF